MSVRAVPDGYRSVTPYLIVPDVDREIAFLQKVFDADEIERVAQSDGRIMHAEVRIGDSVVMMGEATADLPPMPTMLHVYVEDVHNVYRRALDAGATSLREPTDEFYGDRSGGVQDAYGNQWWIATHVEDVSEEEMRRRMEAEDQE